jgi:hypothetical protein
LAHQAKKPNQTTVIDGTADEPASIRFFGRSCTMSRAKFPAICAGTESERSAVHRDTLELAVAFFSRTIGRTP